MAHTETNSYKAMLVVVVCLAAVCDQSLQTGRISKLILINNGGRLFSMQNAIYLN